MDKTIYESMFSKQLSSAFTIKLSLSALLEEVFQGHVGNPNQTKRIVRQAAWINNELHQIKKDLGILSSKPPKNFSIIVLEKSVEKMMLDCKKMGVLANQIALSRIRHRDSIKEYKKIRGLLNGVLHNSSQLCDQLKTLETIYTSKTSLN